MDREDTGSPTTTASCTARMSLAGMNERRPCFIRTTVNIDHHWQTHADVRSVDIKIQAVFTAHKIRGENVEGKFKSLRLKTNVSMCFRSANRWASMNWWLRGLKP